MTSEFSVTTDENIKIRNLSPYQDSDRKTPRGAGSEPSGRKDLFTQLSDQFLEQLVLAGRIILVMTDNLTPEAD